MTVMKDTKRMLVGRAGPSTRCGNVREMYCVRLWNDFVQVSEMHVAMKFRSYKTKGNHSSAEKLSASHSTLIPGVIWLTCRHGRDACD
jgi:hypothetical protein